MARPREAERALLVPRPDDAHRLAGRVAADAGARALALAGAPARLGHELHRAGGSRGPSLEASGGTPL
eukprot:4371026-Pyramimonas_sp.AAC.1